MTPEPPTRVRPQPAPEEPTRVRRPAARSYAGPALAAVCGLLLGVLVTLALAGGGDDASATRTERVTITAPATTAPGGTVITRTLVPALVGEPLDVAKQRTERARFAITVDSGGGVFGVIRDENWEVAAQRPPPGDLLEQGSTVHVDIVRR